jgi:hypothetical protein
MSDIVRSTVVSCRTVGLAAWLIACACSGRAWAQTPQQFTPQQFTGVGQTDVTTAIATFKAAIGGSDNGTTLGTPATGFRQVTWDDVPDALAAPSELPGDFYVTTSPRGMRLNGRGYVPMLQVSASPGNPTDTPTLFGNRNPAFPSYFRTYSAPRLFIGSSEGGPSFDVRFDIPGLPTATATVSAFGAVFTDVGMATSTTMELFDIDGRSYGRFAVPAASGHQTLSFLGVLIPGARIAQVQIRAGTDVASYAMPEDERHDVVALDDFIYGEPQPLPPPAITLATPIAVPSYNATTPFLTVAGRASNASRVEWTNNRGGSGVAGGTSDWSAQNIPISAGANDLTFTVTAREGGGTASTVLHVNSDTFDYYLAEGSTGYFFDTDILIANPNTDPAPITVTFSREDGVHNELTETLPPTSRRTIHVDGVVGFEAAPFSTRVVSLNRLPLVVERAMFWDQSYYGGKGAAAVDTPSETWVFAEGVQNSFFNTFVLLQNPNEQPATANLTFARDLGEPPVIQQVALPGLSRVTIDAGSLPDLVGRSFGLSIHATLPIVAERSTYFETTPTQLWGGGHGSPGVTTGSQTWYFAEGATGAFRDTFLLLSNPTDQTAHPTVQFYGGKYGYEAFDLGALPPHGRMTVPVESLTSGGSNDHPLAEGDFVAIINSYWPIVAERAMYWVGPPGPWADGTSTFGTTAPGSRWGFAEGRVGGPRAFHTYVRVLNPFFQLDANVNVTFLTSEGKTIVQPYTVPGIANPVSIENPNFITIDVNTIPGLDGESFGILVESTNGVSIVTERSMYWDANGVFWAAGLTTAGTRLP